MVVVAVGMLLLLLLLLLSFVVVLMMGLLVLVLVLVPSVSGDVGAVVVGVWGGFGWGRGVAGADKILSVCWGVVSVVDTVVVVVVVVSAARPHCFVVAGEY